MKFFIWLHEEKKFYTPKAEIRSHRHSHQIHVNPENFEIIAKFRNESHLERLESLYQRTLKSKIINQNQPVRLLTFTN